MRRAEPKINLLNLSALIITCILVILPFNAFASVWVASVLGGYRYIELVIELAVIIAGVIVLIAATPSKTWQALKREKWLTYLMIIYMLYTLLYGLFAYVNNHVNLTALAFALVVNLRFFLFFLLIFALRQQISWHPKWVKIILVPATAVMIFGLAQLVLPTDFLTHFGYSQATIQPIQDVNNDPTYPRIQSTLRGANPLGAYLIIIISTALVLYFIRRNDRVLISGIGLLACLALFYTYSRSAAVGVLLSIIFLVVVWYGFSKYRLANESIIIILIAAVIALTSLGYGLRNNHYVQNVIFHTNTASKVPQSSNDERTSHLRQGLHDLLKQPLGDGPGTAGPASVRNDHPARIAENYFVQLGQEIGVVGLALFLWICGLVAYKLWQIRQQPIALAALGSFIGVTFVNMLSHAWTDQTLSLLWWGLAAIALTPAILNKERKR